MKRTVLFLCTGNSCRSQMAEALLRHLGGDRFSALSAGSNPAGYVHGLAIDAMKRLGIPMVDAESKSWDVYEDRHIDVVITLCDEAAGEACPVWQGNPVRAHWSLPDPAFHPGTDEERLEFAMRVASRLKLKIEGLVAIDFDAGLEHAAGRIQQLGEI